MSLTQIAKFLKSEGLLIFFGIIALFLVLLTVSNFSKALPEDINEINDQVAWQGNLYPGTTTQTQLIKSIGNPIESQSNQNGDILFYQTNDQFRKHEITISNGIVSTIKEQIIGNEAGDLNFYINKYGTPKILYGKHGTFAPAHFWEKEGLIVFANINDKTIIEIWYFQPSSLSQILVENPELQIEIDERP